jgi:hypothetical protein
LLDVCDMVHQTLARFSRVIPERLERAILRREVALVALPLHWVA